MDKTTGIIIAIGAALLIIAVIILLIWLIKRRKKKKNAIPQELLDDFNEIERRYQQTHGEGNPHTILWNYAREKSLRAIQGTPGNQPAISNTELYKQPTGGQTVQVGAASSIGEDKRNTDNQTTAPGTNIKKVRRFSFRRR